ncbi:helix-turn-helix domain-containing protein [Dietzia natronolimnaea]|uniref:helix-turn-helix domain-containing protein n=1 Tax=Dietzia natronolimnaea TaxID=161920 RepID=UPI0033784B17
MRTLNRHFQRETGQSPIKWFSGVRLRHARKLLETTDRRVDHTARHVGFSTPSGLRTQIRRTVGVTPSEYLATSTGEQPSRTPTRNA